jgi:hypothetical protein
MESPDKRNKLVNVIPDKNTSPGISNPMMSKK